MVLDGFTYVFAIGSIFALLEAYNNGASAYRLLAFPSFHWDLGRAD